MKPIEQMKKLAVVFVIAITLSSCNQSKKNTENLIISENQITKDSLTAELDSIQKNGEIIGFAVAMVNQDGVLYEKGFGLSNLETKEKYDENTIQHIASVSKTLIGIALMKAKEMGRLDLEDPIENYLPFKVINPNYPNETITIRQLATHTSGINDTDQYMNRAWILTENQDLTNVSTDYPAQRLNPSELNIPMEEYLNGYLAVNGAYYQEDNCINFKPGERYNYSNKLEEVDIKKHSRLYRNDNTLLPFYTAITYPDGMLISSSSDIAKYLAELVKGYSGEGTLLSKDSYKELFTEQLEEENFESRNAGNPYNGDYSPALFIGHSALGYIGHSGGDAGVGTWMYFDKEKKTGRYIVINTDMGNDERAKELEYYAVWDKMNEYFDKLNVE